MARGTGEQTRARIKASAATLFRDQGMSGASVREIAAAAQVDPALVIRHFRSKELLFLETMELPPGQQPPRATFIALRTRRLRAGSVIPGADSRPE